MMETDWEIKAAAFEALSVLAKLSAEYDKDEECEFVKINQLIEDGAACLQRFRRLAREATGNCPRCNDRGVYLDYFQYPRGLRCLYVRCDCGAEPMFPPEHEDPDPASGDQE